MERPSSQLENMRPSGLPKLQSRLPAPNGGRTLQETTSSDLNTKAAVSNGLMGPPTTNGPYKHKLNGLPEPAPKQPRRTLAERAGEPASAAKSHLSSKPSIGSMSGFGSRPQAYRGLSNVSASSSASALRPSSRQTNANGPRPPSSARPPSAAAAQPPNDDLESDGETGALSRRKGTPILSFDSPVNSISVRKTRTHDDLRQHSQSQALQPRPARSQHSGSSVSSPEDHGTFSTTSRDSSLSTFLPTLAPPKTRSPTYGGPDGASQPSRNVSLITQFAGLIITPKHRESSLKHRLSLEQIKEEVSPSKIPKYSCTPNTKLRHAQSAYQLRTPSPKKPNHSVSILHTPAMSVRGADVALPRYLTKEKLSPVTAWDTKGRLEDIERQFLKLQSQMETASDSKSATEEALALHKTRVQELTNDNRELSSQIKSLSSDLERARNELHTSSTDLRQVRRDHERELQDLTRKQERELETLEHQNDKEQRRLEREKEKEADQFVRKLEEAKKKWEKQAESERTKIDSEHWDEMDELRTEKDTEISKLQKELDALRTAGESRATESASEVQSLRDTVASLQSQLDASNATVVSLRSRIPSYDARITALEQEKNALVSKTHFLEGNQEAQSQEFTTMRQKMEEAIASKEETMVTLRREETLRRKLNAQILELRGNIRVFARTRPLLNGEDDPAKVEYLEEDSLEGCKEMVVHAPMTQTATGKQKNEKHNYSFDRVFAPGTANTIVFQECQELIQSVVDGYNVSILSYGQTGSGKTFGMSGPQGIIPSSIGLLLSEMHRLREKGWEYAVEASFVEVYNETLNDLLGDAKTWDEVEDMGASKRGNKKDRHEIHHDPTTGKTTVTNLTSISLWPPPTDEGNWPPAAPVDLENAEAPLAENSYTEKAVANLLDTAAKNRRVAATKANERSSRSHSIFMLTLKGTCAQTSESSEGVLNLVDLAGSERLKQSGAEGSRMKETQAINKSLSALGDVIASLGSRSGNSEAHVPYRNSKLTYLLQSSLGGTTAGKSSRTLMLLHLSPLQAHWQESRSSLLFGSKVANTHIGTARKR